MKAVRIVRGRVGRADGAEADAGVGKGSVGNAATTRASHSVNVDRARNTGEGVISRLMGNVQAVTTEASRPAIEHRRSWYHLSV